MGLLQRAAGRTTCAARTSSRSPTSRRAVARELCAARGGRAGRRPAGRADDDSLRRSLRGGGLRGPGSPGRERPSGSRVGDPAAVHDELAVHRDVGDALAVVQRVRVGRRARGRCRGRRPRGRRPCPAARCRGRRGACARRAATSSCAPPPRGAAASRRARSGRGCAAAEPQARGCDFSSEKMPSSAWAPESVHIETSGCASAARTSSSLIDEGHAGGVAAVRDHDVDERRRAGPCPRPWRSPRGSCPRTS